MNENPHERIQRWARGESTADELGRLRTALRGDAELRALYLDYVNLDTALGALAEASAKPVANRAEPSPVRRGHRFWLRSAAAIAAAALVVWAALFRERAPASASRDIFVVASSAQAAIYRLHAEVPPSLPAWMSPTASLLDQPGARGRVAPPP